MYVQVLQMEQALVEQKKSYSSERNKVALLEHCRNDLAKEAEDARTQVREQTGFMTRLNAF